VIRVGLALWAALALSAGTAFILAALLVGIAWAKLRTSAAALEPSKEELLRNLQWMKHALTHRGGPS
jgi:hypothetical protein